MPAPAEEPAIGRSAFPEASVRPQTRSDLLHGMIAFALAAVTAVAFAIADLRGLAVSLAALVVPSLGLLAWQRSRTPQGGARIEAGKEGLFADGKLLVPRADMTRAVVLPSQRGAVVSIQRTQGFFVALDVPSEAEGRRLTSALGLSADQRTAEFMVDSALGARVPAWAAVGSLLVLLGVALGGIAAGTPALGLVVVPWYLFILAWLRPTTLSIGTDGILLSWIGRRTLIPFSEMVACVPEAGALRVELAGGGTIRIPVEQVSRQRHAAQPEHSSAEVYVETLAARIEDARAAAGRTDITVLDRKDRPILDWVSHLRALTAREAAGFRAAPVFEESLWKTVENGHAEPAVRAAAAVALGPSLDEGGRERLRVAAGVVVAPKLRVVLEAAARGEDDVVVSALGEMEAAREAARAGAARKALGG